MLWLHRLRDSRNQVLMQLAQIHLIAQRSTERCQGFGSVILATVEATIDELLDAMTQGLEYGGNDQRGGDDGNIVRPANKSLEEDLQHDDQAKVDQGKNSGQRAVDQGSADYDIDIVEPIAHDRYVNRHWTEQQDKDHDICANQSVERTGLGKHG